MKTKIGTEVAHVTRNWDTSFKVKRSKVNLQGAGAYCGGLPHSLLLIKMAPVASERNLVNKRFSEQLLLDLDPTEDTYKVFRHCRRGWMLYNHV